MTIAAPPAALAVSWMKPSSLTSAIVTVGLIVIVCTEIGLLIGFFLPGDSLLSRYYEWFIDRALTGGHRLSRIRSDPTDRTDTSHAPTASEHHGEKPAPAAEPRSPQ